MPANLSDPFGPSCCDGGGMNTHASTQPCGCDPGLPWFCAQHRLHNAISALVQEWKEMASRSRLAGLNIEADVQEHCALELEDLLNR